MPHAPTFHQRTQPWHALRAATCTASSIVFLLGVLRTDRSEPFRAKFVDGGKQPSSDVFAMQWGVRHEMNGVASLIENFPKVSESIATKLKLSVPREVHALEQGLQFVSRVAHSCKALCLLHPLLKMHCRIPKCIVGRRWRFHSVVGSEVSGPI